MTRRMRTERDSIGEMEIPAEADYGIHTARAVENFPISGTPVSAMPDLVRAFGHVKKAAARANRALGVLDDKRCWAIQHACDRLMSDPSHPCLTCGACCASLRTPLSAPCTGA